MSLSRSHTEQSHYAPNSGINIFLRKFALPYSQHQPTPCLKYGGNLSIAGNIALNFLSPVLGIILGSSVSTTMAVPKTTVYKNCDTLLRENKIGPSFNFVFAPPANYSIFLEYRYESDFS